MHINPVDNKNFEGKKFRLVATAVNYDRINGNLTNFRKIGKYVQEYSNPKAKELYEQAQKTNDIKEKIRLYREMGDYELKSLNLMERLKEKFNKFIMDNLF